MASWTLFVPAKNIVEGIGEPELLDEVLFGDELDELPDTWLDELFEEETGKLLDELFEEEAGILLDELFEELSDEPPDDEEELELSPLTILTVPILQRIP